MACMSRVFAARIVLSKKKALESETLKKVVLKKLGEFFPKKYTKRS